MRAQKRKFHIKSGDTVYVNAGRDREKTGKVIRMLPKEEKAVVEGLGIVKRHARPSQRDPHGGIIEKEAGIQVSNLMLYCKRCSSPAKAGRRRVGDSGYVRYCKRCGEEIID